MLLPYLLYIAGSLCFLIGTVISLYAYLVK